MLGWCCCYYYSYTDPAPYSHYYSTDSSYAIPPCCYRPRSPTTTFSDGGDAANRGTAWRWWSGRRWSTCCNTCHCGRPVFMLNIFGTGTKSREICGNNCQTEDCLTKRLTKYRMPGCSIGNSGEKSSFPLIFLSIELDL